MDDAGLMEMLERWASGKAKKPKYYLPSTDNSTPYVSAFASAAATQSDSLRQSDLLKFIRFLTEIEGLKPRFVKDFADVSWSTRASRFGDRALVVLDTSWRSSVTFPIDIISTLLGLLNGVVNGTPREISTSFVEIERGLEVLIKRVETEIVTLGGNKPKRIQNLLIVRYAFLAIRDQVGVAAAAAGAGTSRFGDAQRWVRAARRQRALLKFPHKIFIDRSLNTGFVDGGVPAIGAFIKTREDTFKSVKRKYEAAKKKGQAGGQAAGQKRKLAEAFSDSDAEEEEFDARDETNFTPPRNS